MWGWIGGDEPPAICRLTPQEQQAIAEGLTELRLCEVFHCLPSALDSESVTHLTWLMALREARERIQRNG